LPSRAPELNLVENIWQYLRQNWLSNTVFENYDAIIDAACAAWRKFIAQPETIGEGLSLLEKGLGCTLPESQQEGGLSVGAVGPQGASRWRDYPRRSVRARSFAP
jgi:hypothetical protein